MAKVDLTELVARLRDHIIGTLHTGELRSGDRLPSIREVSRRMGVDQRRVGRAYRALEAEGLVEIRGRSGVYASPQAMLGSGMLEETAEWLAGVLLEGWKRRIAVVDFPDVVRRHVRRTPPQCAFIDTCGDAMEAFGYELREEFGMRVIPVRLNTLAAPGGTAPSLSPELWDQVRESDLLVTTIFSTTSVRALAAPLGKPAVTVSVHPQAAAKLIERLRRGRLTVVCSDLSFGDRIRLQYADHISSEDQLNVVVASDRDAVGALDPSEPVLLTRAARRELGDRGLRLLIPHSPTLSPASAHEIIRWLIRWSTRSD